MRIVQGSFARYRTLSASMTNLLEERAMCLRLLQMFLYVLTPLNDHYTLRTHCLHLSRWPWSITNLKRFILLRTVMAASAGSFSLCFFAKKTCCLNLCS